MNRAKISAIGVIRDRLGHIRTGNIDHLDDHHREFIAKLVEADGFITAESYPHIDERFSNGSYTPCSDT